MKLINLASTKNDTGKKRHTTQILTLYIKEYMEIYTKEGTSPSNFAYIEMGNPKIAIPFEDEKRWG